MLLGVGRARQPVFDFVAPHGEQRREQRRRIVIADPRQFVVDDVLDRGAGGDQVGGRAFAFAEAERALGIHQAVEAGFQVANGDAQRRDHVLLRRDERRLDTVERLHRQLLRLVEGFDLAVGGVCGECHGGEPHRQEPALEIARGLDHGIVAAHAVEGAADFDVARHVGEPIGEKADDRHDAERGNAGANRQPVEDLANGHSFYRAGVVAAVPCRGTGFQQSGNWLIFGKTLRSSPYPEATAKPPAKDAGRGAFGPRPSRLGASRGASG